jgi:hypothetical protein
LGYSGFANTTAIPYGIMNYKNRLHGKVKKEWGLKFQAIHLHKKSDRPSSTAETLSEIALNVI